MRLKVGEERAIRALGVLATPAMEVCHLGQGQGQGQGQDRGQVQGSRVSSILGPATEPRHLGAESIDDVTDVDKVSRGRLSRIEV